jgi:nicotinate-nucleotide adenylyltransferase
MRIGLLGGTFDPVHCGHLDAALAARDAIGLTQVLFVPAHVPPHRDRAPQASAYHRFAMTALAVLEHEEFLASDLELSRPGPSFSVDTLRLLHAAGWRASQLFFITGVDAFGEIATWRDYPALLDEGHFVVVTRPGHSADALPDRVPALAARFVRSDDRAALDRVLAGDSPRIILVEADTTAVSSTEIRRRVQAGDPIHDCVPVPVARHIARHRLYEAGAAALQLHGQV